MQGEEVDAHQVAEVAPAVVQTCRVDRLGLAESGARRALVRESGGDGLVGAAAETDGPGECARARVTEVRVQGLDGKYELVAGCRLVGNVVLKNVPRSLCDRSSGTGSKETCDQSLDDERSVPL